MTLPLTEARQAAEILAHAGASPRRITRENALIAWCLLIEQSTGDIQTQAMNGLVNAALMPLEEGGDQYALMAAAVTEVNTLAPRERAEVLGIALSRVKAGGKEGTYACQLALMLTESASPLQGLGAYFRLIAARGSSLGRTVLECLPSLLVAALITSFVWVLLSLTNDSLVSEPERGNFVMQPNELLGMLALWCTAGVACAGLPVPTRLLRTWLVRVVDVLMLPALAYLVVFVFGGWRSWDIFLAFYLSMLVLRIVVFMLPRIEGLGRHMFVAMACGGGWASATVLLVIALTNSAESSLATHWSSLLWLQLSAAAGFGWSEVRSLPVGLSGLSAVTSRTRQLLLWLGPVAATLFMLVGYARLVADVRDADQAWHNWLRQQPIEALRSNCSRGKAESLPGFDWKMFPDRFYRIDSCEEVEQEIVFAEWVVPRTKPEGGRAMPERVPRPNVRDQHMYETKADSFLETVIGANKDRKIIPHYVCFGDCPARSPVQPDITAAAILTLVDRERTQGPLVDLPPASWKAAPPDPAREIKSKVAARGATRRKSHGLGD